MEKARSMAMMRETNLLNLPPLPVTVPPCMFVDAQTNRGRGCSASLLTNEYWRLDTDFKKNFCLKKWTKTDTVEYCSKK